MRKQIFLLSIGILLVLMPFSGFTRSIKNAVYIAGGVVIIAFALKTIRKIHSLKQSREVHSSVFIEKKPHSETVIIQEERSI